MKITFIYHSSFLIECTGCYLLFDYYQGELPELNPGKPVYIMASHQHYDHFSPVVFQLVKKYPKCTFLLSDDISKQLVQDAAKELGEDLRIIWVREGSRLSLRPDQSTPEEYHGFLSDPTGETGCKDRILIQAFGSTDLGVSFLVRADDRLIFHAGDLNDWCWTNEWRSRNEAMQRDYLRILGMIKEQLNGKELDVLCIPMDPVLGVAEYQGTLEFLERIRARAVFPMHMWERYSVGGKFLLAHPEYRGIFHPLSGSGYSFSLDNPDI